MPELDNRRRHLAVSLGLGKYPRALLRTFSEAGESVSCDIFDVPAAVAKMAHCAGVIEGNISSSALERSADELV